MVAVGAAGGGRRRGMRGFTPLEELLRSFLKNNGDLLVEELAMLVQNHVVPRSGKARAWVRKFSVESGNGCRSNAGSLPPVKLLEAQISRVFLKDFVDCFL